MCKGDIYWNGSVIPKIYFYWLVFILTATNVHARDLYTEKDKRDAYSGAYEGCIKKQTEGALSNLFKPEIIPKFCQCFANSLVDDLFGSIDFQIALSNKNSDKLRSIYSSESSRDKIMPRFNNCMERMQIEYGGMSKLLKPEISKQSTTKVGLEGESRRSFVMSGAHSCVAEVIKGGIYRKSTAEDYCSCAMHSMADGLSLNDLIDSIAAGGESVKMKQLGPSAIVKCSSRLK